MLPIKKIYVDSRHRTPDSIDTSNFKIELPYSVQLPDNTVFFVTDVSIPHVFQLIEKDINDRIYYTFTATRRDNPIIIYYISTYITLPPGNYTGSTLASSIQSLMNANLEHSYFNITFNVSWQDSSFSIIASCSGTNSRFKFLTDDEITSDEYRNFFNKEFDPSYVKSANDILKIHTPTKLFMDGEVFTSDFITTQPIYNIYITSPNLGSFDTISPFSNNVIKKVPINVPYGYMIVDQNSSPNDYLNCSRQTLRTIEFHLKDSRGRYINLHGMNVSFSIVFNKFNMNE